MGIIAGQKPPDKTLYPYNTHIWQPSWCCSTLSKKMYVIKLIQMLHTVMLCYHWLLSIHMCTFIFVFPSISRYFPLRGIGQVLDSPGYHWTGRYFPGITALVFPVYISQPMFTLVLVLVLGVSVLDVLEYLIGENAKYLYLYLYLITSTWSIWVLDQLYLTPTLVDESL